jgi:hypothetical protein
VIPDPFDLFSTERGVQIEALHSYPTFMPGL